MKAFFVGLISLIAASVLIGIGILLYPLSVALVWFLRFIVMFLIIILAIWLLGKLIISVWERIKK
ncbi:MAG: hypothetical protein JRI96_16560 [Deltaproteobacteria bacterium]|nr:hypothetical protein [Deltaproteobacteria bacterium]